MSASIRHFSLAQAALSACALNVMVCAAFAQTPAAPIAPTRVDVPDGAPELVTEKNVSNTSVAAPVKASASVIVEEERVQGRLANARISVGGGKGYTVVDPNAGRTDRQAGNSGKRVNPSLWELFRF
jgi:electron transfer flavoprotein alpha subunit